MQISSSGYYLSFNAMYLRERESDVSEEYIASIYKANNNSVKKLANAGHRLRFFPATRRNNSERYILQGHRYECLRTDVVSEQLKQ
jgi:hypothetical protein